MLIGESVCLAPILQADANLIYNWHNTQEVMHLDGIYRPINQGRFDDWFNAIGRDPSRVVFAIRRRSDMAFLGYVQVANINGVYGTGEVGIMVGDPANRGRGFGSQALALLTDFCWRELNLQRLWLQVVGPNERAIAAYLRAGFTIEGVARRAAFSNGRYVDCTLMARLRPLDVPQAQPTDVNALVGA